MKKLNDIIHLFTENYNKISAVESLDFVEIKVITNSIKIPEQAILENALTISQRTDNLSIAIQLANNEADIYSKSEIIFADFVSDLINKLDAKDVDDVITLTITIAKNLSDGSITIYSLDLFSTYLAELHLKQSLSLFSKLLSQKDVIVFKCVELTEKLYTQSIYFTPIDVYEQQSGIANRKNKILSIHSSIHSSSFTPNLLAEDFIFIKYNDLLLLKIPQVFEKCALALSITALFDITDVIGNDILYKLSGYKTIEGKFNCIYSAAVFKEFYAIYNWTYTSGNLIDKLGLARNIISLHLEDANKLLISGNPYQSILSGYQVYQKQNIKQYIEIRNKISEQLTDFNKRATQIVENFASGFQKSALTLVTFFSTLVAIKFLTASRLTSTFTLNALVISFVFLAVSVVYLLISRKDALEQKTRFEISYINLKKRYTDLLTIEDIQKILNEDVEYQADIKFIYAKLKWYSRIWWITLSLIFLASCILFISGTYENASDIVDVFINGYLKSNTGF